ncbi:hypothetical protein T265_01467 [Opisthorchis viverrini]|uniref:Uncharacterized protein n=1 Tax=Opisthorchis viverrini TaxID=6198 RepID=A0A074ZY75_OPIVI|nr:hypothetical protein T265_01467 [Opisthorchis viverrini]KER32408.1 hypothetical protein T265_01467 [Opisthorchis viverrini]
MLKPELLALSMDDIFTLTRSPGAAYTMGLSLIRKTNVQQSYPRMLYGLPPTSICLFYFCECKPIPIRHNIPDTYGLTGEPFDESLSTYTSVVQTQPETLIYEQKLSQPTEPALFRLLSFPPLLQIFNLLDCSSTCLSNHIREKKGKKTVGIFIRSEDLPSSRGQVFNLAIPPVK